MTTSDKSNERAFDLLIVILLMPIGLILALITATAIWLDGRGPILFRQKRAGENGRSDIPMHLHTEDDLYYVQHYSMAFDIYTLLKTVTVVLRGKGAYY